jgi:hypothetical protein
VPYFSHLLQAQFPTGGFEDREENEEAQAAAILKLGVLRVCSWLAELLRVRSHIFMIPQSSIFVKSAVG